MNYLELSALIVIVLLGLFLILRNFKAAFVLLLILSVLLHKELFSVYRWDILPVRLFMLSFLLFLSIETLKQIKKGINRQSLISTFVNPFVLPIFLLWIFRGVSILNSKDLTHSLSLYAFFTTITFLGIFLYKKLLNSPQEVLSYVKSYIFVLFILSLFGFFQLYLYTQYKMIIGALWNIPGNLPRIGASFWDVNHFAALLASLLPVLGALILTVPSLKAKLKYAVLILPMTVILLLTNSRSAWILAFTAFVIFTTILFFKRFAYKGILMILLAFLVISVPLAVEYNNKQSPVRAKIKQYFHYRLDSFDSHFMLITGAFQVFEKYPILGGGYGSFFEHFRKAEIAPEYFSRDPAALNTRVPAHSIWGENLAETGFLGTTAFTLFVGFGLLVLLYLSLTTKDIISTAMLASVSGLLTAGIFYSYSTEFFWLILFLYFLYGYGKLKTELNLGINTVLMYFNRSNRLFLLILFLTAAALIFGGLGRNHLIPWDEAIYSKIAKNMLESKEYIVMTWRGNNVWYEKPPLYMWLMVFSSKLLGLSSLALRLPSAVFGFLLLVLTYFFGKRMFNRTAGFLGALSLLTTTKFLYYSRVAMLDITTAFFITLSLYCYWLAKEKSRYIFWILAGAACGFAVMTKGIVGLLPLPIIGLYELYLWVSKKQSINLKMLSQYALLMLSALIIFLPWHLEMYRRFGNLFTANYIGYHVIERATSEIEDKKRPWWWYWEVMKVSMRIWFAVLLAALPLNLLLSLFRYNPAANPSGIKNIISDFLNPFWEKRAVHVFLSIWFLFILVFFSAAKSKLIWYIIPVYPVASLMVGYFIERCLNYASLKLKFTDSTVFKNLAIFVLFMFSLTYLTMSKIHAYESDLTGPQAVLLELKDQKFGTELPIYADRIDLPLILYYSKSPFEVVDFGPLRDKLALAPYTQRIYFITKESRFRKFNETHPTLTLYWQEKEWVLGFLPSAYEMDKEALLDVQKQITDLQKRTGLSLLETQVLINLKASENLLQQNIQLGLSR